MDQTPPAADPRPAHEPPEDDQPGDAPPARHAFAGRLIVAALVGLFVANLFFLRQNWSQVAPSPRGGDAPDFSVMLLNGSAFSLAQQRGHAVFVDFWATWCGPCRESLPILDKVYREHKDTGLRVVAIETESAGPEARLMAARLQLTMPIGLGDGELSGRYGVSSIPHLVLINKKGQVKRVFRGVHSQAELSRAAAEAEAEAP